MKTVVLLHGFGESSKIWDSFITLLPTDYQYFTPDYSKITFCQTVEEYADWLHLEIEEKNLSQFTLIGHSMGGYIALAYAEKHEDLLTGLGLFHSTSYADTEEKKATRLKTISFIQKHGSAEFLEDFLPNMFSDEFKKRETELVKLISERNSTLPAEALIATTAAMRQRPDRQHILKTLGKPILMIIGKKDKFIPYEQALEQITLLQNPIVYINNSIAHAGMLEAPEACAAVVKSMLDR